jgi:hypothetical protein
MRKEKKKPLTERSIKMICTKCKGFTTNEIIKAFEESVISQYTSIFPKHDNGPAKYNQKKENNKNNNSSSSFHSSFDEYLERTTIID